MMDLSIGKLFIAGIIPGMVLTSIFIGYIFISVILNPSIAPMTYSYVSWKERFDALKNIIPIVLVIIMVLGSIYGGIATPTEAAALGVTASIAIAGAYGRLNFKVIIK